MTSSRLIEIEMLANANPGTRSAPLLLELVAEVRRLQARSAKRSGFVPPSVEEVEEVFAAGSVFRNGSAAKAAEFIAFYTARNWKLSKGVPMSCWKSACKTWEMRALEKAAPSMQRTSCEPRM